MILFKCNRVSAYLANTKTTKVILGEPKSSSCEEKPYSSSSLTVPVQKENPIMTVFYRELFLFILACSFLYSRDAAQARAVKDAMERGNSTMKCFLDSGILVSFPENADSQSQQDVLISLLFAQLAADASYKRMDDASRWYDMFDNILQNVGWALSNEGVYVNSTLEPTFVMASVALNLVATNKDLSFSEADIEVLRKAFNYFHTLSNEDPLVSLFYGTDYDEATKGANLIIASFETADTKETVLKLVMFEIEKSDSDDSAPRFLLHVYSSKSAVANAARTSKMVLNEASFSSVRATILAKLGDRVQKLIKEVPITY